MKSKIILLCYFLLLIIEIIAELNFLSFANQNLIFVTKPLLMPTLIVWAFLYAKEYSISFNTSIIAALIFSLFGDIALMLLSFSPHLFIVGLICFLIAHVIYIITFIKIPSDNQSYSSTNPVILLPVILYGGLLIWFLYHQNHPEFVKLQVPVIIYASVILTMLLAVLSCHAKVPPNSFNFLFMGAVLFVFSDTTIALSKFSSLFENQQSLARLIIMILYGLAQFLIIKGYISIGKKSTIHIK